VPLRNRGVTAPDADGRKKPPLARAQLCTVHRNALEDLEEVLESHSEPTFARQANLESNSQGRMQLSHEEELALNELLGTTMSLSPLQIASLQSQFSTSSTSVNSDYGGESEKEVDEGDNDNLARNQSSDSGENGNNTSSSFVSLPDQDMMQFLLQQQQLLEHMMGQNGGATNASFGSVGQPSTVGRKLAMVCTSCASKFAYPSGCIAINCPTCKAQNFPPQV